MYKKNKKNIVYIFDLEGIDFLFQDYFHFNKEVDILRIKENVQIDIVDIYDSVKDIKQDVSEDRGKV